MKFQSKKLLIIPLLLCMAAPNRLSAQTAYQPEPGYGISWSFAASGSEIPFWFSANHDGLIKPGARYLSAGRVWNHHTLIDRPDGISFFAGAEAAGRLSDTENSLHFLQLYAAAEYGNFRLRAGRFYDTRGIYMEPLSMGSMTLSRNATPVPKIKLETTRYSDIPFTGGLFQFHATWSDGRMEQNRYISSPYLHQKSFHLKLNIQRFALIGGFDHNVIWGGSGESLEGHFRSRGDYFRVITGRSSDSGEQRTGARLGNSVASYDFGVNFRSQKTLFRAYRTFYIETTAASRFRSAWDGVWGFGLKKKEPGRLLQALLYEHMNTIRQDSSHDVPAGRATYYNHQWFRTGWSYHGSVLGNPLLTFERQADTEGQPVTNNQILAHHLGLKGAITPQLTYTFFANYSRNYGICNDRLVSEETDDLRCTRFRATTPLPEHVTVLPRRDFRRDRYSFLIRMDYLLPAADGIRLHGAVALDRGDYSGSLNGILAGISWKL